LSGLKSGIFAYHSCVLISAKGAGASTRAAFTQAGALTAAAARELSWGLPEMSRELAAWKSLAHQIPDPTIRADALVTFDRKVGHSAGAAIFATLPARRNRALLGALLTFQMVFDLLDDLHERHPTPANGLLFQALVDAVTPGNPIGDYYAEHPWKEDGGYLANLVRTSQERCRALPSFEQISPLLTREARRASRVLAINHLEDQAAKRQELSSWVDAELADEGDWQWFELTAAASGQLASYVLLALAGDASVTTEDVSLTHQAYWPMIPMLTTMLDSYADQELDRESGAHSYISHYGDLDGAIERLAEVIAGTSQAFTKLPGSHRHAVIFSCMVAFYLSSDSTRAPDLEAKTQLLIRAGGPLTQMLAPVLRIWRIAYKHQAA
jgi:tetraprenyl-beta-curcumene synthase